MVKIRIWIEFLCDLVLVSNIHVFTSWLYSVTLDQLHYACNNYLTCLINNVMCTRCTLHDLLIAFRVGMNSFCNLNNSYQY